MRGDPVAIAQIESESLEGGTLVSGAFESDRCDGMELDGRPWLPVRRVEHGDANLAGREQREGWREPQRVHRADRTTVIEACRPMTLPCKVTTFSVEPSMEFSAARPACGIAASACLSLAAWASPASVAQERRPVEPPAEVTVEYHVKVVDKEGAPVALPDGTARFRTNWDSKPEQTIVVPLRSGRCFLTAIRSLEFHLEGLEVGALPVLIESQDHPPLADLAPPVVVNGLLLESVELHVVADEDDGELDLLEVSPEGSLGGLLEPRAAEATDLARAVVDADGRTAAPLRSPLKIAPTRSFGGYDRETRIVVRRAGRVGMSLPLDFMKGGRQELRLRRPLKLTVRLSGYDSAPVTVPDGMAREAAEWLQRPQPHLRPVDLPPPDPRRRNNASRRALEAALAAIEQAVSGSLPAGVPPELEPEFRSLWLRVAARGFASNTMGSIEGAFDAQGLATFDELLPGRYLLTIETKGLRPERWNGSPGRYIWKTLPGRIGAARLVDVAVDGQAEIDLSLAQEPSPSPGELGVTIRDRTDDTLRPVDSLQLRVAPMRILDTTEFERDLPPLATSTEELGHRWVARGDAGFATISVVPARAPWFVPVGRIVPLTTPRHDLSLDVERATGLLLRCVDEGAVIDALDGLSSPHHELFGVTLTDGDGASAPSWPVPGALLFVVAKPGLWQLEFPKGGLFGERPPMELDLAPGGVLEREVVARPPPPPPTTTPTKSQEKRLRSPR